METLTSHALYAVSILVLPAIQFNCPVNPRN